LITSKSKTTTKPDAQGALDRALEWAEQHPNDPFSPPVDASDWALISIAASLREIAGKLK
jgi:hypothetical protein